MSSLIPSLPDIFITYGHEKIGETGDKTAQQSYSHVYRMCVCHINIVTLYQSRSIKLLLLWVSSQDFVRILIPTQVALQKEHVSVSFREGGGQEGSK